MNKKILAIGSTIACIILLVAGLSPVVGYNSARSSVKDSPLFSVRAKRAIDQKSESLTCEYVGKGDIWLFPRRDNPIEKLSRVINAINKMNDANFNRLSDILKNRIAHLNEEFRYTNEEVMSLLFFIRDSPENFENFYIFKENSHPLMNEFTWHNPELLCFMLWFVWGIFIVISFIVNTLFNFNDCGTFGCYP